MSTHPKAPQASDRKGQTSHVSGSGVFEPMELIRLYRTFHGFQGQGSGQETNDGGDGERVFTVMDMRDFAALTSSSSPSPAGDGGNLNWAAVNKTVVFCSELGEYLRCCVVCVLLC